MPKPRKVGQSKLGLSKAVKSALAEHGGKPLEHRFVEPVVSGHLLEKLRLPEEKLSKAKVMAAHNTRLMEANANAKARLPITVKSVRKIIEIALEEIPGFMERNKEKVDKVQMGRLKTLQANLGKDLDKMRSWNDEWHSGLSPEFMKDAINIHLDEIEHLMGEKKFNAYKNAMRRTLKIVAQRKR